MTADARGFLGYGDNQRRGAADQAWFWTEQWQQREREVGEHLAAGRVTVHESGEDLLAHLDDLDAAE